MDVVTKLRQCRSLYCTRCRRAGASTPPAVQFISFYLKYTQSLAGGRSLVAG